MIKVGIDIGGTFTDFIVISNNKLYKNKVLTSVENPYISFIDGLNEIFNRYQLDKNKIEIIIHGTTLFTNKLIERKGTIPIFITTKGFIDLLDMQNEMRYDIYDLHADEVKHLVPKFMRFEVDERVDSSGKIHKKVNTKIFTQLLNKLSKIKNIDRSNSVAICLLNSFINPENEFILKNIISVKFPDVNISLSNEISPLIREYERMSTTICNAYIQPLANNYLDNIVLNLEKNKYTSPLRLMLSSGGITSVDISKKFPIRLIESGPAAGAIAAAYLGKKSGYSELLSFDMGGTTAKMCVISNGKPNQASSFEVGRLDRFKRGSGIPINIDTLDLIEIGAGGGSIAEIDELGMLKVGPSSAGADPGPACYNLGGKDPTVTDANLILGHINKNSFLGGKMVLSEEKAHKSIEILSKKMNLSILDTAFGIFRVVNENMITATRVSISEFGYDPRKLYLFAYGGAGPIHAHSIAKSLKMPGFIVPTTAGVASSLGFLSSPPSFEFSKTYICILNKNNLFNIKSIFKQLEIDSKNKLYDFKSAKVKKTIYSLNIRHSGQGHDINLECSLENKKFNIDYIKNEFYKKYESIYGYAHKHLDVEITLCKVIVKAEQPNINLKYKEIIVNNNDKTKYREIYDGKKMIKCKYMKVEQLLYNKTYNGPLILQSIETTCIIPKNCRINKDEYNNIIVKFNDKP